MNREDIVKALELCADSCGNCEDCPLGVLPGGVPDCMNKLIREARNLILSERRTVKKEEGEPCKEATPWTRHRVLREAEKCVCGQRDQDYGAPEDSFQKIGTFWTAYLNYAVKIDAEDVAAMMALLKIARISESPQHMDSWVDGCGYFACGGEIAGKEAQK